MITPSTSQEAFEKLIKTAGADISDLTPAQGMALMLDFYRDVRVIPYEPDNDSDMLLFQWGTYDFFGDGEMFQLDMTRQFIETEDDEDQGVMSQLSFTFHFVPTADLESVKSGDRWCATLDELNDFQQFIKQNAAYKRVHTSHPAKITLDFELV